MERRLATWDGRKTSLFIVISTVSSILLPYGFIIAFLALLILCHQVCFELYSQVQRNVASHSSKDWDLLRVENNGVDVYGFVNYQKIKSDMVVFIHGWQSSSEKYTERMRLFKDRGLHTMAIDMRGHGMAPDTPEWIGKSNPRC